MFGALGSISDQNFYMPMQNVLSLEKCRIFDFHFQIREMAGFVFPICSNAEAIRLQ